MEDENITEKQLISFLLNKQKILKNELKKVELALEALSVEPHLYLTFNDNDQEGVQNQSFINAIKQNLSFTEEFDPNSKLDYKIAFALSQEERLTKDDILAVIIKQQPDLDKNKFEKTLSVRLSYLLKNKFIRGKKNGRTYLYSLLTQGS
ncbi:soluble adenylyl cyclase-like protein [Pedobacter sp. L105]|uniref:soluble adenylyl cyclase-like protein n=1 Tax=Pedobacter sp. L105 TaxID=1641871 RepID=UPI00131B3520|nr:soluble adenylyl cyclase-like protein [Pedobacter sp. L105]